MESQQFFNKRRSSVLDKQLNERLNKIIVHTKSWSSLSICDISFTRLTGFTNVTYKVMIRDNETKIIPKILVVREFCQNLEFFDRDEEEYIFEFMSDHCLGPKKYGGGKDYRLEEFIFGVHPTPSVLSSRDFRLTFAKYLVDFHNLDLNKLDKFPHIENMLNKGEIFKKFHNKIDVDLKKLSPENQEIILDVQKFVNSKEVEFLMKNMPKNRDSITFCHNDLNANNIFIRNNEINFNNSIVFIDFEYSSYNFRGYDIGNFFNENTFNYNYDEQPFFEYLPELFPSDDNIYEFAVFYTFFKLLKEENRDNTLQNSIIETKEKEFYKVLDEYQVDKIEFYRKVDNLIKEIKIGVLLSLFHWILWCGNILYNPDIDFDYVIHAKKRMELYLNLKTRFFK